MSIVILMIGAVFTVLLTLPLIWQYVKLTREQGEFLDEIAMIEESKDVPRI